MIKSPKQPNAMNLGGPQSLPPQIVTYPSYGFQADDSRWRVNVSGVVFTTRPLTFRQRMLVRMLGKTMRASEDELGHPLFQQRVLPFFAEPEKGLELQVTVGDRTLPLRRKTQRNGRFFDWPPFSNELIEAACELDQHGRRRLQYTITSRCGSVCPAEGVVHIVAARGVSVISDIDDTIKKSHVGDRKELLANTFLREFQPVDGMADVYRDWHEAGAEFHYVSSSPWQLFSPLRQHQFQSGFPSGTMHLRNFRLRGEVIKKMLILRRHGKATAIRQLLRNLPLRQFIMVGDSGEKDPEIYRKICHEFPHQIKGVFIREIEHRPMMEERVRKLHKSMNGTLFRVFTDPQTLKLSAAPIFESSQTLIRA